MKIRYNSPVTLTMIIASTTVFAADALCDHWLTPALFTAPATIDPLSPLWYLRLVTYVMGHANWTHLSGNLTLLLLAGPLVEEKYGPARLGAMIVTTAVATAILNTIISDTGIIGASGIVFMLIVLSSFANARTDELPITFILAAVLFGSQELVRACAHDQTSQLAHLAGGACGAVFGFVVTPRRLPQIYPAVAPRQL
ncbi:MAG: rhomboid family intramembrane serine protease [Candidatus Uhrbacteria bacterium]